MTVIFSDIHEELESKIGSHHLDYFYWWELVYADETMLIGKRAREINMLLAAIEKTSAKYNLRLNYDKCNYIGMNGKANILGSHLFPACVHLGVHGGCRPQKVVGGALPRSFGRKARRMMLSDSGASVRGTTVWSITSLRIGFVIGRGASMHFPTIKKCPWLKLQRLLDC